MTVQEINKVLALASNAPHPNLQSALEAKMLLDKFVGWYKQVTAPPVVAQPVEEKAGE